MNADKKSGLLRKPLISCSILKRPEFHRPLTNRLSFCRHPRQQILHRAFVTAVLPASAAFRGIQRLIGMEPKLVDDLIEESGIPTRRVLSALTVLEIDNLVRQHSGKRYTRTVTVTE